MTDSARKIFRRLLKVLKVLGIIFGILWVIVIILLQLVLTESFLTEAVNKYVPQAIEGARLEFKHINATAIRSFPYLRITLDTVAVVYDHDKYASYDSMAKIDNVLSNLGRAEEADTLLALSKMSVGVNYLSLICGTINIHDVQVNGMRVFARQFGSLDANWNIFKESEDEEQEEDSGLPDIVLRNFGMDDGAFVIYNNAPDTLFAAIALRRLAFDGKIPVRDLIGGSRIGLEIDSVFVAGRTATDTIATGLDFLNIHRRSRGFHELELQGGSFVSLADGTRMSVPAGLGIKVKFPNRDLSRILFKDLRVNVASAEAKGSGDISFYGDDTTSIKADISMPRCDIAALLKDFAPLLGPEAGKIKTDAVISASLSCDGLYVPESDALPALSGEFVIPRSNVSIDGISGSGYIKAEVKVSTDENGRLDGKLNGMDVNMAGLRVRGDASGKDLLGLDPSLWMDLVANADLKRLSDFLPADMSASGKIEAGLKGQASLSHLNVHNFSSADLEGYLSSDGLHYADSAITAYIGKTSLSLEKSKKRLEVEKGKVLVLEGGADTLSVDMLPATNLRASGVKISVRNADKIKLGGNEEYRPIMANVGVARLRMVGEDSLVVSLRGSENIFKASQKVMKDGKKAPLVFIKSDNKRISLRQGRSRTALRGVGLEYSSSKEPAVRDNRRKRLLDSLQRVWPGVPRDSLFRKYMRKRGMHKLPDYLQDKSFREKDIHINLGESFTKYLREWTVSGKAGIDDAMFITPSFPLRNKLSKLAVNFNNNEIHLDSLSFRSGRSDLSAKGSITGLRGVIGRSPRPAQVTLNATSRMLNINELFAAMDAGQKYAAGIDAAAADTLSDADYLASFAIDSTQMTIEEYPLIVIPANININVSLQGNNVKYSTLDIDKFSSEIAMKERCLQLKNTLAHSNMGNIDLQAFYSTKSRKDISLGFDLRLSDITADKVITMIPAADTLLPLLKTFKGTLNCELAATSDLDTNMNFLTHSIAGILKIGGKDLEIQQNDAVRKITRLLLFKNKQKTTIDEMQVLAMISNNEIEVFPFALSVDRYRLALGGVQNFDNSFKYHLSVLKSPIPFKFGINITGNTDKWKWRFGGAKYKSINTPLYRQRIDTMHLNLVESIRSIFEKGAQAAVAENRRAADTAAMRRWILPGGSSAAADTLSAGEKAQMDSLQFAYDHPDSTAVAVDSLSVKVAPDGTPNDEKVSDIQEKSISLQSLSDSRMDSFPRSFPATGTCYCLPKGFAGVLKLVDKPDLGSGAFGVWVRVPSPARNAIESQA